MQLGRLTGGGGSSAYLHGAPIATPTPATQAPASSGVGSLLGGVLGSIGGTALLPGLGTIGGGAAGSALGDALEQAITHSDHHVDLGSVGEQGALGLAGGVGGKALGLGAKALTAAKGVNVGLKGLQVAEKVAPKAGDLASSLAEIPGKMTAAGKADATANKLLASQYGTISKPVARSADLHNTVGTLARYGITKPSEAEQVANAFTGGDGLVSKAVRSAAGSADRVSTDGIRNVAEDALLNNQVSGAKANAFKKYIDVTMNKLSGGPAGTLKPGAHPSDALDVVKNLESKGADLTGKGGTYHLPTSEDVALAKVHYAVANELKDRLYSGANVQKVLTPEFGASLKALQPNNAKWANFVDNTVMKSKDIGQLRSTMKPFVNISKVINEAALNGNTYGGRMGNAAISGKGLVDSAVHATVGSDVAKRTAAGVIKGVTDGSGKIGTVAKAAVPQVAVRAVFNAATAKPGTPDPATQELPVTPQDTGVASAPTSAFSPEALQAMAINDIHATGGKNLDKIAQLNALFGPKSAPKSAAEQSRASDIQDALSYIDTADQQLKQLGGAEGPAGASANIPVVGQFINPKAAAYNKTKIDIATAIAKALTGSRPAASVIRMYAESLPLVTDTPAVAAQKMANIRLELNNKGKSYGITQ